MSVRVAVDGGWVVVESTRVSPHSSGNGDVTTIVITTLTVAEALNFAADLIHAAVGAPATTEGLRLAAHAYDLASVEPMPHAENGSTFTTYPTN